MDPAVGGGESDGLSDYSSCEGSEFDKYCSANSALGTASCCSSSASEFPDSFNARVDNRSIRDKFWRSRWNYSSPDDAVESPRSSRTDPRQGIVIGSELIHNIPWSSRAVTLTASGGERADLDEDCSDNGLSVDEEDSMVDYGSDDGSGRRVCVTNKQTELESGDVNPLLMSSSTAFGVDDWDEFVQENGGNGFAALTISNGMDGEVVRDGPARNPLLDGDAVEEHKEHITTDQCSQDVYVRETQSSCTTGSLEELFGELHLPQTLLSENSNSQFHSTLMEASLREQVRILEVDGVKGDVDGSSNSHSVDALEEDIVEPMLCVTAVNPFLYSKVPALLQVVSIRKKIGDMLPYVRCPFRRSILRGLAVRRHLLENNDFFALRDLVDLSKGAFAALPIMLETISGKIFEHITQQCLECYDSGVPCASRQACEDPSSLIFPFQEAEAMKCGSCGSIFHKPCFLKLMGCPCIKPNNETTEEVSQGAHKALNGTSRASKEALDSGSTSGFLSEILSKARPDKLWKPKNRSPVILMSSLPSTCL